MGYPTEIANAMPKKPSVPLRDPFSLLVQKALDLFRRPQRKARRSDCPGAYGQGVQPRWPRVRLGDSGKLDFNALERDLEHRS